jgi:hypothetical protein
VTSPLYRDLLWNFVQVASEDGFLRCEYASEEEFFLASGRLNELESSPAVSVKPFQPPRGLSKMRSREGMEATGEAPRRSIRFRTPDSLGEVEAVGKALWQALREPELPKPSDSPMRVKISSTSFAITDLPWECLTDSTGAPLALQSHVRLARSVPVRYPLAPLSATPPLIVLVVMPNPKDERLLDPYREIAAVNVRLLGPGYKLHVMEEPSVERLRRMLSDVQPHIVHYIGHSGSSAGEGSLILHDSQSYTYWLRSDELAAMLPASVRLLCLSTCITAQNYDIRGLSRFAHAPPDVPLPSVVLNQLPLDVSQEHVVQAFWSQFYESLHAEQGNVTEAHHRARVAASNASPNPAWTSFSLVIRDGDGVGFHLDPDVKAERHTAELEAFFRSRLANALTLRSGSLPNDTFELFNAASRGHALDSHEALARVGGAALPKKPEPR